MSQFGSMMQQPWMNGPQHESRHNGIGSSAQDPQRMSQHPMIHVVGDVKPRLTKEQHDILEAHFRQQHKPSTQTKKGFAENLGVPLDKINNWFQNRRAKVKQDAKKLANAQTMFLQQQMAQQMQNGNAVSQHSEFLAGQPHLGPSAFPMDNANPNFIMHNQQAMMTAGGPVPEAHMMSVSNYPTTDLDIGTIASKPNYMAFDQSQDFSYNHLTMTNVQDFGAIYGGMTGMEGVDFAFMPGAPMQITQSNGSTPSIPSTLSSMPSHSTMPSSAGGMNMPTLSSTDWNEDNKPTICFSEASDSIVNAQSAYCSPPEDNSTARWVSQQPSFGETASPENIERPSSSQNLPPTPPDTKPLGELELPAEAFSRRPSSTHDLSESLGNVDIQTRSSSIEAGFKQPGEPSSIAARRQRPRPAALGQAALRSASYSAGMPTSPGSNPNNLSAPEQQLRRIRSSGVPGVSSGRVQKQNAPGQRSPLHMSFADAADSPKFTRHASAYAAMPSPGMHSLAPPTPLTPAEGNRFPSWQSYGSVNSHHNSVDHSSPNGIAVSWTAESPALFQPQNVSSPPDTPLDTMQAAQYNHWAHAGTLHRDTPPQSAPAFQQSFNPAMFGGSVAPEPSSLAVNAAHLGHIRRPSLPEQGRLMPPQAPMYNTSTGDVPLTYQAMPYDHMQHMPPQPQATLPSQTTAAFPTPPQPAPASIPNPNNILPADFAVHEYLPPGAQSSARSCGSPTIIEHASGPKMFHFSNTGPKDFAGQL